MSHKRERSDSGWIDGCGCVGDALMLVIDGCSAELWYVLLFAVVLALIIAAISWCIRAIKRLRKVS